jgi:hypothetical protein
VREFGTEFCPDCTQPCITPPPIGVIYDHLHTDYPDLVATPDDLRRVAHTYMPLSRQAGYAALKAAGKSLRWFFRST